MAGGLIFSLFWDSYKRHVDISDVIGVMDRLYVWGPIVSTLRWQKESFMLEAPMEMPSILES